MAFLEARNGLLPSMSDSVIDPQHPGRRAPARQVAPHASADAHRQDERSPSTPPVAPRIAAIIVTWNRKNAIDAVLRALSQQNYPLSALNIVVVDNGSTDGTADFLIDAWRPEIIADNPTSAAHEPDFRMLHRTSDAPQIPNSGNFASLAIVRNAINHGGCGGFNTGLAFLEHFLDSPAAPLDYAWLVDDDVDLPPDALRQLTATAQSDPTIGIVGSRTVDFDKRDTTTETTIYFDFQRGWMGPEPAPGHPMHDDHHRWAAEMGGTRGPLPFTGVRNVDVVSACSLLARWSAVKRVGLWDSRYFIYCDDADWCLRFRAAGYRVVVDLDAVVYHTYWLAKLTPARGYYSQRNLIWVIQKTLSGAALKKAMFRRLGSVLRQSFKAMTHCRLFHAEIIRRTAHDVITGRGGRLTDDGPAYVPVLDAFHDAGALRHDATVMVMCSHHDSIEWADDLRSDLMHTLIEQGRPEIQPRWIYMVRNDVPDPRPAGGGTANASTLPDRITFEPNRKSKWRVQKPFLRTPPTAVVIFDQHNDFPLLHSRYNIHIERRRPDMCQPERDGTAIRARFLLRWFGTALRSALYAAAARRRLHAGKYG